jgi:hypothetical protein
MLLYKNSIAVYNVTATAYPRQGDAGSLIPPNDYHKTQQ